MLWQGDISSGIGTGRPKPRAVLLTPNIVLEASLISRDSVTDDWTPNSQKKFDPELVRLWIGGRMLESAFCEVIYAMLDMWCKFTLPSFLSFLFLINILSMVRAPMMCEESNTDWWNSSYSLPGPLYIDKRWLDFKPAFLRSRLIKLSFRIDSPYTLPLFSRRFTTYWKAISVHSKNFSC